MPTLNIGGVRVNIGDEFLKMSPQEQEEFVQKVVIPSPEYQSKMSRGAQPAKPPGPPQTDRGLLETFGRSAVQGATFNFGDELAGVRNAASQRIPETLGPIPLRMLAGAARLAMQGITGRDPSATTDYEAGRDQYRTALKEGEQQNPITSTVGNLTGSLAGAAMPGGAVTLPAKAIGNAVLRRMAEGALTGAASGAVSGVGEGENLEDRLTKGAAGGVIGGTIGGVAPAVLEGVGQAGRAVTSRIASTVRGARDPELEAARRFATAVDRDIESDPNAVNRLTNREFAENVDAGGPATLMDLGGETVRAVARSAANQSPEGRAIINRTINDRFEGQSGRVNQWLRDTFHYPDAEAQSEALLKASREVNKPAYAKAYAEGASLPWDETFEQITQSPHVQEAIRKAMITAKNEAAKMGFTPPKNPFQFDDAGRLKLKTDGDAVMTPNLQFWDHVKRNLDRGPRDAQDWSRILRDRLDELVPSYGEARAGAARYFDADNALEAGQKFLSKNMTRGEAQRALAQMTPQERQLFQDGFVSKYMETLDNVKYRRDVLNQISESPAATEKLHIALGPEKANQLEANLRVEGIMDFARNAVQKNSTTVRQLAEMGLAGSAGYSFSGGGINPLESPGALVSGLLSAGAAKGRQHIEGNVARKLADLMVSQNPKDLQRGVDIIRKSPRLMNALRGADKYIARVAGEEGSGAAPPPDDPIRVRINVNEAK